MLRDDKPADAFTVRHGPETDDYNRDFIERDEKRLADLGRRTVEMYVIAHIIADLEVGHLIHHRDLQLLQRNFIGTNVSPSPILPP